LDKKKLKNMKRQTAIYIIQVIKEIKKKKKFIMK